MKNIPKTIYYSTLVLLTLAVSQPSSRATTLTESFNDYGETRVDVSGLGDASGGWAGPWAGSATPDYYSGVRLTYDNPNYGNDVNLAGSNHGAAGTGGTTVSSQAATRSFETAFDGTIWISALMQRGGANDDAILWLNRTVNSQNYLALRGNNQNFRYANTTSTDASASFSLGVTHLLLARIDMNVNVDGHDEIRFWVNPDLSGGETGLGDPYFLGAGADAYGASFSSIGVSFGNSGGGQQVFLDSLRISDAADGFVQVIQVPEPSTFALLGLGAGLAAFYRSSRRR